eukprot:2389508-Amphidinium_carterae.1
MYCDGLAYVVMQAAAALENQSLAPHSQAKDNHTTFGKYVQLGLILYSVAFRHNSNSNTCYMDATNTMAVLEESKKCFDSAQSPARLPASGCQRGLGDCWHRHNMLERSHAGTQRFTLLLIPQTGRLKY